MICNEPQQVTLSCCYNSHQFVLSCIYANHNSEVRKELWNSLLQPSYNQPWMEKEDFNVLRSQKEKVGGLPVDANALFAFNNMISQVGFLD